MNIIKKVMFFNVSWLALMVSCLVADAQVAENKSKEVRFLKHTLTNEFISEGVAVGDVNNDGKIDIIAGAYWFEAPDWKRHEIDEPKLFSVVDGYSNSFHNYAMDVNQDGWIDIIRVDFPGTPAVWYENPKNKEGHWKKRTVYPSVGNENPIFVDVDGDGRTELICADPKNEKVVWIKAPTVKNDTTWTTYVISDVSGRGTKKFTHGLGFGDINNDGRADVFIREGWWEAPDDLKQTNWTFHPANFGDDCAQMYALDLNGNGYQDVISSSVHNYGIWWHEQTKDADGNTVWKCHEISKEFSQTHALSLVDINRNGHPDLVTGKRYFAHNGKDPGAHEPSVLYWFEYIPGEKPVWIPHQIDDNSGVGLHIVTQDINEDKLVDIIIANKKGVFFFEQLNN